MRNTYAENTMGTRIREMRKAAGMSQEQLAEILCTKKATISAYENDHIDIKSSIVLEIAKALNCSGSYLLEGKKAEALDARIMDALLELKNDQRRVNVRKLMTCSNKRSTAMTEKNLIRVYTGATSEKRIDIIIKNYTKFIGIVDGYTDGLRYMIECEKESSHRQSAGDLGVRVQTGGMTSDPTARKAINNVITREALINCDFSGNVLDGVDQAEVYIRDAYILRDMRKDYNLFNSQLGILGTEKETFTKYLLKEKTISDIAEDQGITYESARQQMQKIKVRMKKQIKRFMDGQPGGIA